MILVKASGVNKQGNTSIGTGFIWDCKILKLNYLKPAFFGGSLKKSPTNIGSYGKLRKVPFWFSNMPPLKPTHTQKPLKISLWKKSGSWRTPFHKIDQFHNWPPSPIGLTEKIQKKCARRLPVTVLKILMENHKQE